MPVRYLVMFLLFTGLASRASAQMSDSLRRELTIDFEIRPRFEFRDNFMLSPADSVMPELYTTQRNRLTINYKTRRFRLHASPQEVHVWSKAGKFSHVGGINAFELFAEPVLAKNFSVRIGRQALSLDNGRLFSAAPWSQQSRSHEGIRFLYTGKLNTDLTVAFTRPYSKRFEAAYSPVSSHQYKLLVVHHLKYQFKNKLTLTTINAVDVFEKPAEAKQYYQRVTNGGRVEYARGRLYGTVNAFFQYGSTANNKKLRAYYIQPEVSINAAKTTFRLGAEVLSGDNSGTPLLVSHSFVPLYGVAWKFMGNMNLFTRFPADVNEKGLINPYLFIIHQAGKQLSLRADAHLFYSQHSLTKPGDQLTGKYLGFESDLSLNYKPVKYLEMIYGLSLTLAEKRMELLKKVPDATKVPVWSYLMISYTPRLLHARSYVSR